MKYTVRELSVLANVSGRTLRYYDEIGLLPPAGATEAGYRLYGEREVDMLQQIMFYRELGFSLDDIKNIITSPGFNIMAALHSHRQRLIERRKEMDALISTVENTIAAHERGKSMKDSKKFEGFKKKLVDDNEQKYGKEIRERYGDETVEASNKKLMGMSEDDYNKVQALSSAINTGLKEALALGDPASEAAQNVCENHKQWLCFYWAEYSSEAHMGLGEMYVADERFKKYYDDIAPGAAEFLRDALKVYTASKS